MQSFHLLYEYKLGTGSALDSLRLNDEALERYLGKGGKVASRDLDSAEHNLLTRLATIKELRDQIMPEIKFYLETKSVLDTRIATIQEMLKKARMAIIAWARSHRNLAAGIEVPPMFDIVGTAGKALSGAVGKIIP